MAAKYSYPEDKDAAYKFCNKVPYEKGTHDGFLAGAKYIRQKQAKELKEKLEALYERAPTIYTALEIKQIEMPSRELMYEGVFNEFFKINPHINFGEKMPASVCYADAGKILYHKNNKYKIEPNTYMASINVDTHEVKLLNGFSKNPLLDKEQLYVYPYGKVWFDIDTSLLIPGRIVFFFVRFHLGF